MTSREVDLGIRLFANPKQDKYRDSDNISRNKRIVKVRKNVGDPSEDRFDVHKLADRRSLEQKNHKSVNSTTRLGSKSEKYSKQTKIDIDGADTEIIQSKIGSKTVLDNRKIPVGRNSTFNLNDPNVEAVLNSQLMTDKLTNRKYAKVTKNNGDTSGTSDHSIKMDDRSIDNSIDTIDTDDTKSSEGSKKKKEKDPVPIKDAIKDARERARYVDVRRFFRDSAKCSKENIQLMVDIINSNHEISLRNLNWFGTKHLDTMDSRYRTKDNGEKELFDPKISYGKRQGPYGKKGFDPFRRGLAFNWNYDPDDKTKTVVTTLCQLQFFKWLFEYEMMDYIKENLNELKELQRKYEKKRKEEKRAKKDVKDKSDEDTQDSFKKSDDDKNVKLKAKRTDTSAETKLIIRIG